MKQTHSKRLFFILATIAMLFIFPLSASADMGPKPSIDIIVKNPPSDEYYLDLLTTQQNCHDNLRKEEKDTLNKAKLQLLEDYNVDGWQAGIAKGTPAPMFGKLRGTLQDDGSMLHTFGYIVPSEYKIIIITPDNKVVVSNQITKQMFSETVTIDYNDLAIIEQSGEPLPVKKPSSMILAYIKQFTSTFFPTIIIEGIILLLFRFSIKKNWKTFLLVNFLTQIAMTATLGTILLTSGYISCVFAFIPIEIAIAIAESIAYSMSLKEHTEKRRIIYAITANFISAFAGFFLMCFEYIF